VTASPPAANAPPPRLPGWIGYVGYEVGRHVERLPGRAARDTALPDLRLAFYDALLVHDALEGAWTLTRLDFDRPPAGAGEGAEALRQLAKASQNCPHEPPPSPAEEADAAPRPASRPDGDFTRPQYERAVARCVEYIAAGDIFQANLSQRFAVADAPPPLAIYQSLRRRNPAWYSAYMSFREGSRTLAVLSSSPELFLHVRGDEVLTRPIKGTRPRGGHVQTDAAASLELLASEKDNAELAMIVDLLRNDLGRVCRFGTVRVTEPRRLETYATVFHLVATVEGRLRPGVGPAELLRATFPGGSITGAPKVRAMEIIDELEPVARGVYTGCIGLFGAGGDCELNIAIRTIVCDGDTAYLQVGGGVVADSRPAAEYQETLDKARAMLEAIEAARRQTIAK
jgi:para-aminobenzoate synthetase component 1